MSALIIVLYLVAMITLFVICGPALRARAELHKLSRMISRGDAINGYREADRYFVSNHGEVTEVSKTIWYISKTWTILVFISTPLAMIGSFWLNSKTIYDKEKAG